MNRQLNLSVWVPDQPWLLGPTAKYPGKSLEQLMFQNYSYVYHLWWIRHRQYSGKRPQDNLHRHLDWLLQTGERIVARQQCPQCHKRLVAKYAINAPYSSHSCCQSGACQTKVKNHFNYPESIGLISLTFGSLWQFTAQRQRQGVINNLFKWAWQIDRFTTENCWQLFINPNNE